jgi:hypothetical protein
VNAQLLGGVADQHGGAAASERADPGAHRLLGADELEVVIRAATVGQLADAVGQRVIPGAALEHDHIAGAGGARELRLTR